MDARSFTEQSPLIQLRLLQGPLLQKQIKASLQKYNAFGRLHSWCQHPTWPL